MLNRVTIQNFKSIGEPGVDLELKPLTFLVGPNGGGKSSILEAIGVAAQDGISGQSASLPARNWGDIIHKPNGTDGIIDVHFSEIPAPDVGYRLRVGRGGGERVYIVGLNEFSTPGDIPIVIGKLVSEEFQPKTFMISSVRGDISYTTNAGSNPQWVGIHGQDLIIVLGIIFGAREHENIESKIVRWATRFGIGGLKAGIRGGNAAGSDYLDSELDVPINLALSSSGARQILTVITQLFWSPEGSLLMIEEPEISLHPQAQIDALEMFAEAIKEDKQIIATTHGLFMIQAIGYAIQKGWLKPDQIAVYHVEKKKATGTVVKRLPLNKRGYIKGWIPSFSRVERKLLSEWVKGLPEA